MLELPSVMDYSLQTQVAFNHGVCHSTQNPNKDACEYYILNMNAFNIVAEFCDLGRWE